jgi:hypothetical protein
MNVRYTAARPIREETVLVVSGLLHADGGRDPGLDRATRLWLTGSPATRLAAGRRRHDGHRRPRVPDCFGRSGAVFAALRAAR